MGRVTELSGQKFSRLYVVRQLHIGPHGKMLWECRCDCGKTLAVSGNALKKGNTKSCGCLKLEIIGARRRTHGRSKTSEYRSWSAMKSRCTNPNNTDWPDYGGRGIGVCERWLHSFENFLDDMGEKPDGLNTIERKNVNGNYEPGNCVWASQKTQTRNKRTNHLLTHNGETLTIGEWAERTGVPQTKIQDRIVAGWSVERALNPKNAHRWSRRKRANEG